MAVTTLLGAPYLRDLGLVDLLLGVIAFAAIRTPVRFHRRGHVQGLMMEDAIVAAYLFTAHPRLAPLVLVIVTVATRAAMRSGWAKVAFSAAPAGLGAATAVAVAGIVGVTASPLDLRSILATSLALTAYAIVSFVVTGELFRLMGSMSWSDLLRDTWFPSVISLVGNITVGLLLAVALVTDTRAVVLVGVLAMAVQLGYRAYARVITDRRRAEELALLSRSLSGLATNVVSRTDWLTDIARFFDAEGALVRDAGGAVHASSDPPDGLGATLGRSADIQGASRHEGEEEMLIARIGQNDGSSGALAVWGRRGFEPWNEGDAHLLAAIAGEVAVALENAELFRQVERERARWQEESAKLNDILSAASDGIATFSADGQVVSWNPGMAALAGVEAEHAVGQPWWTVLRVRDVDGDDLLPEGDHVVTSALAGERHGDPAAMQVLRRDGRWRWVRATFSPLLSDEGSVDGTVMVARDVTAEHEVEELKADFVATVSHELRTPLTPLKGFLATVRQRSDMLTPQQIAMLHQSMESQVHRLERLVNDLLVVADLDRGRVSFGRELVSLAEAAVLAIREEQEPGDERVELVGDLELAAAADGSAVVRILRALVSNALKHSDGEVTVELARDGHEVCVGVRDDGPGIPPWEHDRVFRRFHRLGDHLHRTQGPGLGLAIAKALTDHLGGSLEVDSDVGQGATFTLRLRSAGPVRVEPVQLSSSLHAG